MATRFPLEAWVILPRRLVSRAVDDGHFAALTTREREIVLAASEGASTGEIAQRLLLSRRTVEHHLSAVYHKLGVANRAALVALVGRLPREESPSTLYALSGDAHIAYQVVGSGSQDLILIPGFVSNVETAWTWPAHAGFLRRLATGRRLIVFDKRGTGLSDPVGDPSSLTLEQRMDEVRAVMDAAESRRAALFGFSEGAALSMLFAATYPSRTNGLILYGALISPSLGTTANPVVGVFSDPAAAWVTIRQVWGTGQFLAPFAPSAAAHDMTHVARFERHGASPAAAYAIIRMAAAIEARALCPAVHAPCLVLHRRHDPLVPPANGRYLAEHLPDARYVELDGGDHPPWLGDNEQFFDRVDNFLASEHPARSAPSRLLQAVLVADRPLSPALLPSIERFRGRPATGHRGVIYTFDGVVRAVECALVLAEQQPSLRLITHVGELEIRPAGIGGPAVEVASAALERASAGQVTTTGVVRDLAFGSGLQFSPCRPTEPTGDDQPPLFRVVPGTTTWAALGGELEKPPGEDW